MYTSVSDYIQQGRKSSLHNPNSVPAIRAAMRCPSQCALLSLSSVPTLNSHSDYFLAPSPLSPQRTSSPSYKASLPLVALTRMISRPARRGCGAFVRAWARSRGRRSACRGWCRNRLWREFVSVEIGNGFVEEKRALLESRR